MITANDLNRGTIKKSTSIAWLTELKGFVGGIINAKARPGAQQKLISLSALAESQILHLKVVASVERSRKDRDDNAFFDAELARINNDSIPST